MRMAQDTCDRVRSLFWDVDFNPVNGLIASFYHKGIYDSDRFLRKMYQFCPAMKDRLNGSYDDYLQASSLESLMSDYFFAFYALLKDNFVYCNQSAFFCRINRKYSQRAEPSIMEAKYCYSSHLKPMDLYSVFFDDDKIPSAKSTDSAKIASEDKGFDLSLRFIRHLSKETWYYFTTAQSFGRVVKEQRELCLGEYSVEKKKDKVVFRFLVFFLNLLRSALCWFQGLRISFLRDKYQDSRKSAVQPFGRLVYKIDCLLNRLKANDYVLYRGTVYTEFDESGQHSAEGSFPFAFLIPASFCYGSADRFGFGFLGDALRASANGKQLKDKSLRIYADELLTPKKSKKDASNESVRESGKDSQVVSFDSERGIF